MPSPEASFDLLKPYFPAFRAIIQHGWEFWNDLTPEHRLKLDVRAQRCVIWCGMNETAKELFRHHPGVIVVPGTNTTFFNIEGQVLLRFKKLDSSGASSNVLTQLQLDLRDPQVWFDGPLGNLPTLDVGYVPNVMETGYSKMLVAALSTDRVAWSFPIPEGPALVMKLGKPTNEPGTVIRPRASARTKKDTGTEEV